MRCEEIMKRHVHSVSPQDSLSVAAQMMVQQNVGFLPVCDTRGGVLGVLTDRDIVTRACAADRPASTTSVESIMSAHPVTCSPTQSLAHAESLMRAHKISRIVVTDDDQKVRGIISLSDVAQYETPTRTAHALYDITSRKYDREGGL